MIVANARQTLADARLRRSSKDCGEIAQTVLSRATVEMGATFSNVEKIVDNRNSVCLKLYDADRPFLLKVNKNPDAHEVYESARRMSAISQDSTKGAFSVPATHYLDREFDAAIMDFIPGTRLDTVLANKSSNPDLVQDRLTKAAGALSVINGFGYESEIPLMPAAMDLCLAELASVFPAFTQRNGQNLQRLAALPPSRPVFLHGDFSPKNIIFDNTGKLFLIDFVDVPDSSSPLRDISIFAIGLARALSMSMPLLPGASDRLVETLVQDFLGRYLAQAPELLAERGTLSEQLVLFELLRLAETKIWLDGYRAFDEAFLGWLKAKLGQRFIASQLQRLQSRLA